MRFRNSRERKIMFPKKLSPPFYAAKIVLIILVLFQCSLKADQFRAAWADIFHVGMQNSGQVDTMVNTLVSGRYNAVIVQVLGYMDQQTSSHGAYWKSS